MRTAAVELMEKAVSEDPYDALAVSALRDAYMEAGFTEAGAFQKTMKAARLAAARMFLAGDSLQAAQVRSAARRVVGVPNSVPVVVTESGPPRVVGRGPYHTFKNGNEAHSPRAAMRAGYRLTYHRDSRTVQVGYAWVDDKAGGLLRGGEKSRGLRRRTRSG